MNTVKCQIKNGRRSTYNFRKTLSKAGFQWKRTGKKSGLWEKDCTKNEARKYQRFCSKHALVFVECDPQYMRSSNYRSLFFKQSRPDRGDKYRCVYCGKLLYSDRITVDHIIPVNKVLRSNKKKKYRKYLKMIGASSVNDIKNLAPSCSSCNLKKSDHGGLWIVRGFLGRHFTYWTIIRSIKTIMMIVLLSGLYNMYSFYF